MKKLSLFIITSLMLVLTACGGGSGSSSTGSTSTGDVQENFKNFRAKVAKNEFLDVHVASCSFSYVTRKKSSWWIFDSYKYSDSETFTRTYSEYSNPASVSYPDKILTGNNGLTSASAILSAVIGLSNNVLQYQQLSASRFGIINISNDTYYIIDLEYPLVANPIYVSTQTAQYSLVSCYVDRK